MFYKFPREVYALANVRLDREYGSGAANELDSYIGAQFALNKHPPLGVRIIAKIVLDFLQQSEQDLADVQGIEKSITSGETS